MEKKSQTHAWNKNMKLYHCCLFFFFKFFKKEKKRITLIITLKLQLISISVKNIAKEKTKKLKLLGICSMLVFSTIDFHNEL